MDMRKPFIVFIFLIAFLTPAYGYPWMAANNSTAQNTTAQVQADVLLNTTSSDKDIILWHLIEVDALQIQSQNALYVRETLIFENNGTQNFSGSLRTWIPAGAQIIKSNESGEIAKEEMTTGNIVGYLPIEQNIVQNGNIVSWSDEIETNSVAFYIIEYQVAANTERSLNKNVAYTKMLAYPALINYQYGAPELNIPPLTLVITKPQGTSVTMTDENGNKINPSDESKQGNTVTERFSSVQFQGFNIVFSSAINSTQIAVYVIIGLLIVIALSYSFLRKRNVRLQAFEEKIRGSLKQEEIKETKKEVPETVEKTERKTGKVDEEDTELDGKTSDELVNLKNEILSKQSELEEEYKSGNLIDEEYEELRKLHKEKIERINRRIEKL